MLGCSCTLFNTKYPQLHVAKDFAVAEKKLHLTVSGRKYDPGKKAPKRKHTSDVKTADPKPSTSQEQPQDEPIPEQQPQDEPISEQQPQDESVSEQSQGMSAAEQQPQDKASDTLTSQSSDDSTPLPDYGTALRTFTTKDPSSVPKKPRYSLRLKQIIFNPFCLILSLQIKRNTSYILENSCFVTKCHMCQKIFPIYHLPVIYLLKCIFAFSFQYQSDIQLIIFLFFPVRILLTPLTNCSCSSSVPVLILVQ